MKRLLAIVFALTMGLAWTLPSLAVEFSGQYRLRGEYRDNADFRDGSGYGDGRAFYGQRIRLTGKASPTDDVKVKVTIQDTREWGEFYNTNGGPRLTEVNDSYELDIHEGYLQIDNVAGTPVAVRMGRQELVYGNERLVGAFGWSNNGRSFDAIKFMYTSDAFDVDAWTAKIQERSGASCVAPNCNNDQDFYGVYATVKTIPNAVLDLYVLLLNDGSGQATFNNTGAITSGTVSDTNLWTYGVRVKGDVAGLDYTVEVPFQTGEIEVTGAQDYDISAWAYAIDVGYAIPGAPMGLRVGGQLIYASGDDNMGDNDMDTFSNLFPTNHLHYGYADQQGWRNVNAWNLNATAKVTPNTTVKLDYWDFTVDEEADCWYGAGNWMNAPACTAGIRAGNSTWDDQVGSEVDITVKHKYNSAVSILTGYSRFFAGDRLDDALGTGVEADDQDWAYFQVTANY